MRKNVLKKISYLMLVSMLLVSLFAGMATAEKPERLKEMEKERKITVEKYKEARDVYKKSVDRQENAIEKYRAIRATEKDPKVLQDAAEEYLINTIDSMIAHLEVVKENAEKAEQQGYTPYRIIDRIDAHISRLNQLKEEVNAAETPQELRGTAKELRGEWKNIRKEAKYFITRTANQRIERFLEKADTITERIEGVIEQLDAAGENTENLKDKLEKFKEEIAEAKKSYEQARDAYQTRSGFDSEGRITDDSESDRSLKDANKYLIEANNHIRKANSILKDIFNQIKKYKGTIILSGNGTLHAEGDGRAVISGNVTIDVTAESATMILSPNAEVTTDGKGTHEELGNGNIKYTGFGIATVSGERIRFAISGNSIVLDATGTGKALLRGQGTYYTGSDDTEHSWNNANIPAITPGPTAIGNMAVEPTAVGNMAVEPTVTETEDEDGTED